VDAILILFAALGLEDIARRVSARRARRNKARQ
jgi:hypothetical protein